MIKSRLIGILLLIVFAGTITYADRIISGFKTYSITESVAHQKVTPESVMDSFTYIDSFIIPPETTVVEWLSPLQTMILTPSISTDSITYGCTLVFGDDLSFEYLAPADSGLAAICNVFTDSINNVADLSDSVVAEDSTTYVKIISKFGTELFGGRWSMKFGDSLDTISHVSLTTVQMIIDSMLAKIAATPAVETMLNVYEQTTYYDVVMKSTYAGDTLEIPTDSAQATTQITEPLNRRIEDTLKIANVVEGGQGIRGLKGKIFIDSSTYDYRHFGELETLIVALRTQGADELITLDTLFSEAIPGTLTVCIWDDSICLNELIIDVMIADTGTVVADSSADFMIKWNLKAWSESVDN